MDKWRTIGGRRILIKDGQSLEDAMRASGKFKNLKAKKPDVLGEKGEPRQFEEYIKTVNPNYGKHGYNTNCVNCAIASELNARGYDVEALPAGDNGADLFDVVDKNVAFAYAATYEGPGGETLEDDIQTATQKITAKVQFWRDGARGFIITVPQKGNGHLFNLTKRDGKMFIYDSQAGTVIGTDTDDLSKYLEFLKTSKGGVGIIRSDVQALNLKNIGDHVKRRSSNEQ